MDVMDLINYILYCGSMFFFIVFLSLPLILCHYTVMFRLGSKRQTLNKVFRIFCAAATCTFLFFIYRLFLYLFFFSIENNNIFIIFNVGLFFFSSIVLIFSWYVSCRYIIRIIVEGNTEYCKDILVPRLKIALILLIMYYCIGFLSLKTMFFFFFLKFLHWIIGQLIIVSVFLYIILFLFINNENNKAMLNIRTMLLVGLIILMVIYSIPFILCWVFDLCSYLIK